MCNSLCSPIIIRSSTFDPWFNLALEEYLFSHIASGQIILFLWQNENTVVIGKHQNPWKECRLPEMEQDNCKLARRMSGGGAVFHDRGNVNFSFIVDRNLYNLENQLSVVLKTVRDMGIAAEFSGRNDLVVQGKKFSGNAYRFDTRAALHHGTILISTDLEKLSHYLNVSPRKILSKGIASVRSRVTNLSNLQNNLTTQMIISNLQTQFCQQYGKATNFTIDFDLSGLELKTLYQKHKSWKWQYGDTPQFTIVFSNYFSWGNMDINLDLENGHISNVAIYSDAMAIDLIDTIAQKLKTIPFQKNALISKLSSIKAQDAGGMILQDIIAWLATENFSFF